MLSTILENVLPKNIPMDLIKIISKYTCDCEEKKCNFCEKYITDCYLTICISCKLRSCCYKMCPKFETSIIISYANNYHKEIKLCRKCDLCLFRFPED